MSVLETATVDEPVAVRHPSPPVQPASSGFVLAIVLGLGAIFMLGLVAIAGIGLATADGAPPTPSTTIDVSLSEFRIDGALVAPAGEVTLRITNAGSMSHNVAVTELDVVSQNVGPGGVTELALGELAPGAYELFCDIAGHRESGMVTTLTITGDGSELAADGHAGHGHGADTDWQAMDEAMMATMLAFPAETEGTGNPVLEPTEILADGTKVFDLTAEIVDWEVEPGKFVEAWTYNGVVPAPQILLDRGDTVDIRIHNELPMSTDVHWHGVHTPNDMDGVAPYTQEMITPGETFTYSFTAHHDAIGMYHAHHHGQMQVVNGMFGAIRIGENPVPYGGTFSGVYIPEDLELAADIPMVLNDAGTIGLSLNGKSFPATEPLVLEQGDWASVTYYNEGLQIHPMHLHQFPQLVYAKDGVPLDHPYWVDTLNVAPGERYTVLFRADDAGTWVWHCHILNHVERDTGMFGMVTAIVVTPNPGFDPEENPVAPSNWRNVGTSADGPVTADVDRDHGAGDGAHTHSADGA